MQKVSVVDCDSYEEEKVYLAIKEAIQEIGFEFPEGKRILIKPNLVSQNTPAQHTITHYALIDALCRLAKEKKQ